MCLTKSLSVMVEIKIDREKCIGCMSCTSVAPEVYEMDDERKAVLREDADPDEKKVLEKAEKGAEMCPVDAIEVEK